MLPLDVVREAIKAVPAVRYALGVGGIIAVIALANEFRIDAVVAVVGVVVMFVLMGVLVLFARMSALVSKRLALPAMVLAWFTLLIFMVVATTIFLSVFIGWPRDLHRWIDPEQQSESVTSIIDGTNIKVSYTFDGELKEHAIGRMYQYGVKVPKDYTKAAFWYLKGVELNDPGSMIDLGELLGNGLGVSEDRARAVELYLKAGRLGDPRGLYKSGLYYRDNGQYKKAIECFQKAIEGGWRSSYAEIGLIYEEGLLGEDRKNEALEWYRKGAEKGDLQSMHSLGNSLIDGDLGEKNPSKGAELLEKVIEHEEYFDVITATWALGDFYSRPELPIYDPVRAKALLKKAALKGHPCSILRSAEYLLEESPSNVTGAIELLEYGVHEKQSKVITAYALRLLTGNGIYVNQNRAKEVLEIGVEMNDVDSMILLGEAYRSGKFGIPDSSKAAQYFSLAAQHGSESAESRLEELMSGSNKCSI